MAIIHSNAIGKAYGSMGMITYKTVGGATIASDKVFRPKVPRTFSQMFRRVRWANLVNLWQTFADRDKPSFEGKAPRVSDFNEFIKANINGAPVYLTSSEGTNGASVVAAYQLSNGQLPTIEVTAGTGGVPVSGISLGGLTIDGDTTLAEFSEAVLTNNENFQERDQITFFRMVQEVNPVTGIPFVRTYTDKVMLNSADEDTLLADLVSPEGFTTVDGKLGANGTINGACTWVHSRKTSDETQVSTQSLYVTNTILAQYQTTAKRTEAILSYGGKLETAYLTPNVDAAIARV